MLVITGQELHANEIDVNWTRAVYSVDNEMVLLPDDPEVSSTALLNTPYKARLFRHDISGPTFYLHVAIPDQGRTIYNSILPLIISSALFIGVLMLAFVYSFRTILRQKRLNDIRNDLVNNLTHELKTRSVRRSGVRGAHDPNAEADQQCARSWNMIRDENKRLGRWSRMWLQSAVWMRPNGAELVDLDIHDW